jgi:hypothetical protein
MRRLLAVPPLPFACPGVAVPLLGLATALVPPASAQIATDRPDFVESSSVVGAGGLQIEAGLTRSEDAGHAWNTPTLLRVGVGDRWELRAESALLQRRSTSSGNPSTGLGDVSLGLKWHSTDPKGALPSTAVLVHADLPTGSATFRGDGVRPSLRLSAEWELTEKYSLGIMPGVRALEGGGTAGLLGVVVGRRWTERLGSFAELALARIADTDHGGTEGTWDVGLTWLVNPALQLDAAVSLPATDRAADLSIGLGVSALFGPGASR